MSRAVIVMGSKADLPHCRKIADGLGQYGVEAVMRIASAHKTPEHLLKLLGHYDAGEEPAVFVAVAGLTNALGGLMDMAVRRPVVNCPPSGSESDLWSSLRSPSGVAPLTVLGPENCALAVAKILGISDPGVARRVADAQEAAAGKVLEDDEALGFLRGR